MEKRQKQHAYGLDFLRILLCIGVVVYHYTPDRPSSGPYMVIGFFVLAGFLLGTGFSGMQSFDILRFYENKMKRFIPMLVATLLGCVIIRCISIAITGKSFLIFSSEFMEKFSMAVFMENLNTPLWYMVVELCFLLMAPFVYYLYKKPFFLTTFLILSATLAGFLYSQIPFAKPFGGDLYFSVHTRCWQFIAGVAAAKYISTWIQRQPSPKHTTLCIAKKIAWGGGTYSMFIIFLIGWALSLYLKQSSDLHYLNYTFPSELLATLFFSLFIPILYVYSLHHPWRYAKYLILPATLTYPMYLVHSPIRHVCSIVATKLPANSPLLIGCVAAVISLACAALLLLGQKKWIK